MASMPGKRPTALLFTAILCLLATLYQYSFYSFANTFEYKFNMSYMYFGDKSTYLDCVKNAKGSIEEISPSYFDLNADGSLKFTSALDTGFISRMHESGIRVVPFLSNHWDRELGRKALGRRDKLADEIVDAIARYNLDGVNVDLENLTEDDRNNYSDFVRLLRQKLPQGKVLAVAVASNPKGLTKGWQSSYDYAALGNYSDYLMLMAYDEHYSGGNAGPVASIGFVEDSIKYALERVPGEKIVLGIPFFGRIWRNGGGVAGQGASLKDIEVLIAKYRGQVGFDYTYCSPKAIITIKPADEKPYIYGKRLGAGTYTIWYENEQSIKQKLRLVQKYGLKGTGSWSLGQETPDTWNYYSLWLNGCYYADVQGHWALSSIIYAAGMGWMIGDGSTSFAPSNALTRAEAAVVLVRALGLEKKEGAVDSTGTQGIFSDISGHWAKNEIEIAAQHRIVQGRGDGTYGPDSPVTREELAVLMHRSLFSGRSMLAGRGADGGASDYSSGNSIDYTRGESASRENSNDENSSNTVSGENGGSIVFGDVSREICNWSYDSIIAMTEMGIFTGAPGGKFLPKEKSSRAEMAVLLHRVWGKQ